MAEHSPEPEVDDIDLLTDENGEPLEFGDDEFLDVSAP